MSASYKARVLLRGGPSRVAQWVRCAPRQRQPFAAALVGGRRWYALDGRPAGVSGAVAGAPGDEKTIKAQESSIGTLGESPESVGEAVASEVSESEVAETPSSTAESDLPSISSATSAEETTPTPSKNPWWPEFGFAFDIDGVLLHKSDPIPGAAETLKYLQRHKIPFILLTNGGGKSEADRVAELSAKLGVGLDTSNFVQSHTPYQLLATEAPVSVPLSPLPLYLKQVVGTQSLKDSTVLVLGSDASQARRIARGYGFQSVVTPGDILNAHPEIFPFDPLSEFYRKQEILPLPKPIYDPKKSDLKLEECLKIDAILVFNDPRDWAVDIQLITDLLVSHRGYLGTYSKRNGDLSHPAKNRWQNDGQPAVVFSNVDLLWSTGYHMSRFGQGAFRAAVRAAFKQIVKQSGGPQHEAHRMKSFVFGKPLEATYHFAASKLGDHFQNMWRIQPETTEKALKGSDSEAQRLQQLSPTHESFVGRENLPELRKVYMVGDNPESDIRGALRWRRYLGATAGASPYGTIVPFWEACLVRTGVWNEDKMPLKTLEGRKTKPHTVQDDVKAVVQWALEREGWPERMD